MKFIDESNTGLEQMKTLFRLLHEVLGWATAIILKIFFCKVKTFQLLEELPETFSLFL